MKERLLTHWPTTLLVIGCILTGLWLAIEIGTLPDTPEKNPTTAPEKRSKAPAIEQKDFSLPPMEQFHTFIDKPLFIQGRVPVPAEDLDATTPTTTTKPRNPPKVQLTGILETPDVGTLVLLRSTDGKHHYRLKPGEEIENWRLSEVATDYVVIVSGEKKHTLKLIKPKPQPATRTKPAFNKQPRRKKPVKRHPNASTERE